MRMDALRELLRDLKQQGLGQGNFLGLLNVLIGRRVHRTDGTLVSAGCSWRTAAGYLKRVRWPRDAVRELEIARMIADDLSDKEIAYRLGVEVSTIRTYLNRIFAKLGVRRRSGVAGLFAKHR